MKKTFKRMIAGISALAIMSTGAFSALSASAIRVIDDYDLNNPEYQAYVDTLGDVCPYEEEIFAAMGGKGDKVHLYNVTFVTDDMETYSSFDVESGSDTYRWFSYGSLYWNRLRISYTENISVTAEEFDEFLSSNSFKAHVSSLTEKTLVLEYDEDAELADVAEACAALNSEYGLHVDGEIACSSVSFTETEETTEPSLSFGTPSLPGDADLDGKLGISDVTKISKFTANASLYPISDSTALANADYNQDGKIDALDTGILLELMLGTYENAVE
ncbi:MAG: dockerin type I domain-containing protein [Porcipelethomonas sp.]